jgi:hypothetical protein
MIETALLMALSVASGYAAKPEYRATAQRRLKAITDTHFGALNASERAYLLLQLSCSYLTHANLDILKCIGKTGAYLIGKMPAGGHLPSEHFEAPKRPAFVRFHIHAEMGSACFLGGLQGDGRREVSRGL